MAHEKRLIDANELRQTVESKIYWSAIYDGLDLLETIDDAPTVDAVEVVRCKDCRHHHEISCLMNEWEQPDNSFCSGGERGASDE